MYDRTSIPSRPLERPDVDRIRARPDVESVISLGTAPLDGRSSREPDATKRLVLLTGRTVSALEYDGADWSGEVLETDADRGDQLRCALDLLHDR